MKKLFTILVAFLCGTIVRAQPDPISVNDVTIAKGGTKQMEVTINYAGNMTAFQFDLTLPTGFSVKDVNLNGEYGNTRHLLEGTVAAGKMRFLSYDDVNGKLTDDTKVIITLEATDEAETATIRGDGIVVVEPEGTTVFQESTLAMITIQNGAKTRMLPMKRNTFCSEVNTILNQFATNSLTRQSDFWKGDINADGILDGRDITALADSIIGDKQSSHLDINEDQKVNVSDLVTLVNLIAEVSPSPTPTPTPSPTPVDPTPVNPDPTPVNPTPSTTFYQGGIYYQIGENNTVSVTSKETKYSGDVVIPSQVTYNGKLYSVTSIGNSAFSGCTSLTHVSIPNSVTTIGNNAFISCSLLHSVTIPYSVTSIGFRAFSGCYLTNIVSEIEKPFELNSCFDSYTYEQASLTVPKGTKSLYMSTVGWRNFLMIGEASGSDELNIVVMANNYAREYGEENPIFEYMVDGVNLNGTPSITCEATKTSPVGTYAIKITKGSVTNSNVSYIDGTLTITKAPLTVTAKDYSREQGQANPTFEVTYSGFKNNETESVLTQKPTASTTATVNSVPGQYDITVSGGEAQNYSFIYNKGVLTVTEKDEVLFAIDGITYQGTKSAKTVVVTSVDKSQTSLEIPASVSYDGTTYQVSGITDGIFDGSNMGALIWDVEAALPNNAFNKTSIGSNFLLYVKSSNYAPSSVKNVVVNGSASVILLSDDGGQFYCPQAFTARNISYTHNYSMETGGNGKGWETIALPFDVQKITHSTRGEIVPFPAYNSSSSLKPFWLGNFSGSGFRRTSAVLANEPYIIAMPNSSSYRNEYNLAGDVTFSADNVQVAKTPSFSGTFVPAFASVTRSSSVKALNNASYPGGYDPGSRFIPNLRNVHPFEAYMTGSSSRGIVEINFDDSTTDMLDILFSADDAQEVIIHSLNGQQVTRTTQRDIDTVWNLLPKGVYIINGKKMIK